MTDEALMPSEVRRKVLSQHREIEQMLSELETGVEQLAGGETEAAQVKRAARIPTRYNTVVVKVKVLLMLKMRILSSI